MFLTHTITFVRVGRAGLVAHLAFYTKQGRHKAVFFYDDEKETSTTYSAEHNNIADALKEVFSSPPFREYAETISSFSNLDDIADCVRRKIKLINFARFDLKAIVFSAHYGNCDDVVT